MPAERLEIYETCIGCTNTKPKVALMNYSHKTAGSVVIIDGGNQENIRIARRAFERKR